MINLKIIRQCFKINVCVCVCVRARVCVRACVSVLLFVVYAMF